MPFPDHTIKGTVDSLAPGTGAQFALLPPENATGNFTKIVQRVPVKIALDPDDPLPRGCGRASRSTRPSTSHGAPPQAAAASPRR